VISLAKARRIKIIERHIMPEEIADMKQCFITGTAAEVTPIGSIDNHKFTIGNEIKNLIADYSELVNGG
jgi:branched-chain amino acid aminotransferase